MTLSTAALALSADAVENAITHLQLHNGAPGAAGTTNTVGSRVAVTSKVAGNATITLAGAFTGLTANQAVTHVSYWTALTSGTFHGSGALTGDLAANSAGSINVSVTETITAT